MRFKFGQLPTVNTTEARKNVKETQKDLPTSLHFTPEQVNQILSEDQQQRDKNRERHKMADYRIAVMFGSKRKATGLTEAKVRVWESAKNLTGEGDVSMHWCGNPSCLRPFSAMNLKGEVVVCPHCFKQCLRENCSSELLFRKDTSEIASLLVFLFNHLKANADILCMWIKKDIRPLEAKNSWDPYKEIQFKDVEKVIYPYWRILDDTMHGGDIYKKVCELIK